MSISRRRASITLEARDSNHSLTLGKLMKQIPVAIIVSSVLISGGGGTASAQSEMSYIGDKASFALFAEKFAKADWPLPETISFFDPAGTGAPVIRYAHWVPTKGAAKGTVVHFNGRTEFIERNIYSYKDLLDRGYEVWALDWRGQGLSERQIDSKQRHSIDSFDTYVADATFFIDDVRKLKSAGGTKVLLAHSMGGQIALRYLLSDSGRNTFDYAVLSSPLLRVPGDRWYVRAGNFLKTSLGMGDWCVLEKPETWASDFKGNSCGLVSAKSAAESNLVDAADAGKYTHAWQKLADSNCLIESSRDARGVASPDLRLACPTSDWLRAAFASTDLVMETFSKLVTPTLIVRAMPDAAVDNDGQTEFCKLAKIACIDVEAEEGTRAGHELLIEVEPIRRRFFREFDGFVKVKKG